MDAGLLPVRRPFANTWRAQILGPGRGQPAAAGAGGSGAAPPPPASSAQSSAAPSHVPQVTPRPRPHDHPVPPMSGLLASAGSVCTPDHTHGRVWVTGHTDTDRRIPEPGTWPSPGNERPHDETAFHRSGRASHPVTQPERRQESQVPPGPPAPPRDRPHLRMGSSDSPGPSRPAPQPCPLRTSRSCREQRSRKAGAAVLGSNPALPPGPLPLGRSSALGSLLT